MRTIAVTGSRSGIGAAVVASLRADGCRVVGIDLSDAEVVADLGDPDARAAAIDGVERLTNGRLDGFVSAAGVGPTGRSAARLVAVNFFGAIGLLRGLRPMLAGGDHPSAVVVSSNTVTCHPNPVPMDLVDDCVRGEEMLALARADREISPVVAYPVSKLALTRWVREQAPGDAWIGSGIRLNAIAPGGTDTPMLAERFADSSLTAAAQSIPNPLGRLLDPSEVAAVIFFLLGQGASSMCGSVVFCDGGLDAIFHPSDSPAPLVAG